MKKIKIFSIIGFVALMLVLFSCESMTDNYQQYIKDGEIIYTTKLDSVKAFAGNHRVLISGILKEAFSVKQVVVYWNDFTDSLVVDYIRENDVDTVNILVENLEEKSYEFDIYTSDGEGHRSVKVVVFGTAYGERYQESLYPRTVNTYKMEGEDTVAVRWLPADELETLTELIYTDSTGMEVTVNVPKIFSTTFLVNYRHGVTYRSWYLPEETAIDSFPTDWTVQEVMIYHSTGTFTHPLTGARDFDMDKAVVRLEENVVETDYADMGKYGYKMKLKVLEDNTVLVIPSGESPVNLEPNGQNTYKPETGEYILNTKYNATLGDRIVSESLSPKY